MTIDSNDADAFLRQVYTTLDYKDEVGYYNLADSPFSFDPLVYSWLKQARELHAETIFFVHNHPAIMFFRLDEMLGQNTDVIEDAIRELHIKVWNTSRTPLFVVALPTELRIYSAYQKPSRDLQEWTSKERWLKRVQRITRVAEVLKDFSRSEVESGRLFKEKSQDFKRENRVDQWLLRNLRLLRQKLEGNDLSKREYVHALIGRSIFVRYLEDRGVLVSEYFLENSNGQHESYSDFLRSKSDTFFLFRKLRQDFNGDIFPLSIEEENAITDSDVELLRDFLLGKSMDNQIDLLFWAYKFNIIPIELISSIYEEFYDQNSNDEDTGTHYTPTELVDFVLSQTLTEERLKVGVRILDPACGSGVFLVEAFKRVVQFTQRLENNEDLSRSTLTNLLINHIVGIDVNSSAVQIAAFSLYLAFLDYLNPRDIRQHKQLPKLIYQPDQLNTGCNLYHGNAFSPTSTEQDELIARINNNKQYSGRATDMEVIKHSILPFDNYSFDIIVGNPPWGADTTLAKPLSSLWCESFNYTIGDKELSQSFMCRSERLLKPEGEIGLLVSTGVLFKHGTTSVKFRQRWLQKNRVRAVYNFAYLSNIFFRKQKKNASAPFVAVFFTPREDVNANTRNRIFYFTLKKTKFTDQMQAVVIDNSALRKVQQNDLLSRSWLWKAYMWGGDDDVELISEMKDCYPAISHYSFLHGRGYQESGGEKIYNTEKLGVRARLATK